MRGGLGDDYLSGDSDADYLYGRIEKLTPLVKRSVRVPVAYVGIVEI